MYFLHSCPFFHGLLITVLLACCMDLPPSHSARPMWSCSDTLTFHAIGSLSKAHAKCASKLLDLFLRSHGCFVDLHIYGLVNASMFQPLHLRHRKDTCLHLANGTRCVYVLAAGEVERGAGRAGYQQHRKHRLQALLLSTHVQARVCCTVYASKTGTAWSSMSIKQ